MSPEKLFYIDLCILLFGVFLGFHRYKLLDPDSKIVFYVILLAFVTETLREIAFLIYGQKNQIYHFYCIIDFLLMIIYFIRTIKLKFVKLYVFSSLAMIVALELINDIYFRQPLTCLNSHMFVLEAFFVTLFGLYALYHILVDDNIKTVQDYPHFWFWAFLLFMSSGTFFFWSYILIINIKYHDFLDLVQYVQVIVNIVAYGGIALVFYTYPKMVKNGI